MLTMVHFALLHEPYYGIKDAFSIILILILFFCFVIISPDKLGHSDNFILANSLVTPAHIVPDDIFYHYMQYCVR